MAVDGYDPQPVQDPPIWTWVYINKSVRTRCQEIKMESGEKKETEIETSQGIFSRSILENRHGLPKQVFLQAR